MSLYDIKNRGEKEKSISIYTQMYVLSYQYELTYIKDRWPHWGRTCGYDS